MKKFSITFTATVNVPVILTYTAIGVCPDDMTDHLLAKAIIGGPTPKNVEIEESTFAPSVEGADTEECDLEDQVIEYVIEEGVSIRLIDVDKFTKE